MKEQVESAPQTHFVSRPVHKGDMHAPTLKSLLHYLGDHKLTLGAIIALSVVGAGLSLAQPMMVNEMIVSVGAGRPLERSIMFLTLLVLGAGIIGAAQQFLLESTAEAVVRASRRRLIDHLLRLPTREYDVRNAGDLVARVSSDTTLLRSALTGGLVDAIGSSLVFFGAALAMVILDPVLFAITLAVIAIAASCVAVASGRIQALTRASQESVGRIGAGLHRALAAIRTIRALGATDREVDRLLMDVEAAYLLGVRVARVEAVLWPISGLALQGSFLAVLGVGGYRVAAGSLSIANLISFILFLFMMLMPLGQVFSAVATVRSALGALARVNEIIDIPREDAEDMPARGPIAIDAGEAVLAFENVSFGYETGTKVINNLSLRVPRGKTTAIVGPSGSGKSTLLALAERFYEPDAGHVRIDGINLRELPRAELRARIGYVEQSAPVLAGSIRDNLTLAAPAVDDQRCREALAAMNLLDRVDAHPDGLDANLGDDGAGLSGGERQRLAIARVLLANAPILLLDEPTASLDSRNEQVLHEALRRAAKGRSVLIVAHRLATVVAADQIAVMDGGRLVATGTHEQLLSSCMLYRELAQNQMLA